MGYKTSNVIGFDLSILLDSLDIYFTLGDKYCTSSLVCISFPPTINGFGAFELVNLHNFIYIHLHDTCCLIFLIVYCPAVNFL